MLYGNKIGEKFDNLAQRVVYSYMISYSTFKPIHDDEVSEKAQKQMHTFLSEVLYKIYNNPTLIDMAIEEDDCFNGEAYKDKTELNKAMKKSEKEFLNFFSFLFVIGDVGEVKDNKLHIPKTEKKIIKNKLLQLERFGLKYIITSNETIIYSEICPGICSGLKLLCNACKKVEGTDNIKNPIVGQSLIRLMFMRCIYAKEHITMTSIYGNLKQSGPFLEELEDYFINKEFSNRFFDASFCLQKNYADKHIGAFNINFNWRSKNQLEFGIVVPGFRLLMNYFNEMNEEMKEFIFSRIGDCRNCGYCTQTDITGKRKTVAVNIEYRGVLLMKCPLYPYLVWNELNEKTVSLIKDVFTFAESKI